MEIKLKQKLQSVKLLILDVDGVLTDGGITLANSGDELKTFNVKDGLGLVLLQKFGVRVAIITGKSSAIVETRFKHLGVVDIFQGQKNKISAFNVLKGKYALKDQEIAYIGDDLPDLPLMDKVGLSVAPKDAHWAVKSRADWVLEKKGGQGAVRAFVDDLLIAHDQYEHLIESYVIAGEGHF